ncbi:polysaccharide biosynthesis protein [Sporolactobacillus shoreae]|uniref:Polysaccharide biosynthesis protein n=1 Tax=Sporolactobacillus shoreae TaxID=1465501 RepID=A0A4Z0GIW1_9BACL|nr:polysaccharide biosynthesis protein [Sporolactobacillus shoreae]TGA96529.1 polysaccharide biosynthesis protein [Sporolactobacillus shoreae]
MPETKKENRLIWRGAAILTGAAVLVKIMSAVYRMPYQNFAGDVGFYVYQQVYPFYALAVALGGTGFPIVISKYIAEAGGTRDGRKEEDIRRNALFALSILCGLIFTILYLFATPLTHVMGDIHLAPLIRTIAAVYLFVPLIAALRGSFQGKNENMLPTAVSQIGEQVVRVALILGTSWYLFLHHGEAYQFGGAATAGSAIAPVASLVILLLFSRKTDTLRMRISRKSADWRLIKELLISGCLFSVLAMPLIVFQFVDSLTVIPLLGQAHIADPRAEKGIYDRAYLLTQFGMIAAVSLTASIVPGLAKLTALRRKLEIQRQATRALRINLAFGLAAAVGLAAISTDVNTMLFRNADGSLAFAIVALTMLTFSLILTASGILEAAGRPWQPFIYLAIGAGVKLGANHLLIPHFSINGAAAATLLATALTAWLNFRSLRRQSLIGAIRLGQATRLCAAVLGMVLAVYLWRLWAGQWAPPSRTLSAVTALSGALIGGCVFVPLLFVFRYFSPADLQQFPFIGRQSLIRKQKDK